MSRVASDTWRLDDDVAGPWLAPNKFGRRLRKSKGAVLYRQGDVGSRFYVIASGQVLVSMLGADGRQLVLEMMGRGAFCGEGAAFDGLPRFSTATVLRDVELVEYDTRRLGAALAADPALAASMLRVIALKQRVLALRLGSAASGSPEARILELLSRLGRLFSRRTPRGRLIQSRLSHAQIAAMTGTARVTVTRTLRRLREAGVIAQSDGLIEVLGNER